MSPGRAQASPLAESAAPPAPPTANTPAPPARVGPNAVLQLAAALRERHGEAAARRLFERAGRRALWDEPPAAMVEEQAVSDLFEAVSEALGRTAAHAVLTDAGTRTADYLLAHRIPAPVHGLLRWLPRRVAERLLLAAIGRNAWTFVGSGVYRARAGAAGRPGTIEIERNPLAPACAWHAAVIERLLRALVSAAADVRHSRCVARGDPACRFEIRLGG